MWWIAGLSILLVWIGSDLYFGRKQAAAGRLYPRRNSHVTFYSSGPELFDQLFAEMKQARHRILCEFYIVKDDQFSQSFFSLLKQKAQSGVEVYLLMDWLGSHKVKKPVLDDLKRSGVIADFSSKPRFPFFFHSLHCRNHRKITVIDNRIGYIGGFNVGREYVNQSPKPQLSPWRDFHLRFTGEGVQDIEEEFLADWNQEGRPSLEPSASYEKTQTQNAVEHRTMPSRNGELEKKLISCIRQAKRSIFIGTPYFIPTKPVFDQLLNALERGVAITILLPGHADHPLVKQASYPYLRRLLDYENVRVYFFENGFFHAKIINFDDRIVDIGTANFDQRSQLTNEECNCFIFSTAFIKEQVKPVIEKDISQSQPITRQKLQRLPASERLKEQAASVVRAFL
ncbi:phospholipase D-like domain-containing protein [Bacillus xiapuensis]|uniref:phospholipase D-like domain-containing protein n=1 Tax=Bacillus xiapuensis TaxID=2014075 RepID=UPI000C238151|nr:phospholipase D-like domain-containing protein [Bacillus xiapuensis]